MTQHSIFSATKAKCIWHLLLCFVLGISGCHVHKQQASINTSQIKVQLQTRALFYSADSSVLISNAFPTARLNGIEELNDSTYLLQIKPENEPINPSPWYAFKTWSSKPKRVSFILDYGDRKHRYAPKSSRDGKSWVTHPTIYRDSNHNHVSFQVDLTSDTLWVAGQELISTAAVRQWTDSLQKNANVHKQSIGFSIAGRPIEVLKTSKKIKKPTVLLIGRQHPPEISGYLAYQVFVEETLGKSPLAKKFRELYDVIYIPMINPDGIQEGQWRHNLAGVDLNRDWDAFAQPETKAVRDFLNTLDAPIYFAADFHSTFHDVYYTNRPHPGEWLPGFTEKWIQTFKKDIPGYHAEIKPSGNGGNVSKGWLSREFGAQAVTYEVGDNTPRTRIKEVARYAAIRLMEGLIDAHSPQE